jgi:RNA polymerase sigma factor (sigma-70 family)
MAQPSITASFSLDEVGDVVRAVLRRKSGMSLREDDTRPDNVDALELFQDVIVRLWERHTSFGEEAKAWDDMTAFAATVTHNAWSDHIRQKHPRRASLRHRLRYFLGHQPRYAVWESAQGETLCGLRAWMLGGAASAGAARAHALRERRERLAPGSVPAGSFERFAAREWDVLLGALFVHVGAPLALDPLVNAVAALVGLKEDAFESLDALDEEGGGRDTGDAEAQTPEAAAEARSMLRQLWGAVRALKPDYRRCYLLNLPGPGKTRGDIEVFVLHGVASIEEIFGALALDERQVGMALAALDLSAADRDDLAGCRGDLERFCVIWRHLPLPDAVIAELLGLAQQQIINRRMLALRELARLLGHAPSRAAAPAAGRSSCAAPAVERI